MASDITFAWPRVDGFVLSVLGLHCSKPWRYLGWMEEFKQRLGGKAEKT
jgi:hypothetical protein